MRIKLFFKNVSGQALPLEVARNVPVYDVTVQDGQGKPVWNCAGEKAVVRLAMNEVRTLAAGESWQFTCDTDSS